MKRLIRKQLTLSHRLLLALGVVSFMYWFVMIGFSTRDNIREVNTLYDVHLAHTAKAFLFLMDPDDNALQSSPTVMPSTAIEDLLNTWPDLASRPGVTQNTPMPQATKQPTQMQRLNAAELGHAYGSALRYQLWRDDGKLIFRSENAPVTRMAVALGYSDSVDEQGLGWRNYAVHDGNHRVKIIISEPRTFRDELDRSMVMSAATPLGMGLPVLFFLLWLSIRRGLLPLAALSHQISQRAPDNLSPMNIASAPDELQPIVIALNGLLDRVAETLENERRFSDDAAHQLRTPLAVIQSQLYNARHTQDAQSHQVALDKLQDSVARAIRMVNQLLTLARLDPHQAKPVLSPTNLTDLTEKVCAELATLALQRDQTLELQADPALPAVMCNADLLSMLISNLVDNAIHYTQVGGTIHILLQTTAHGISLRVCDDGPGIAPGERDKVLQRFYRLANQSQPGTGLGLAICSRIAELHGSALTLSDGLQGHGLCVRVELAA